jgi:DNA-binding NarL/FixJ family response regulator
MNKTIKLLIADDHAVVRKGIYNLFEDESEIEIVGEAENGQIALKSIPILRPDVIILDITMPVMNGIETALAISQQYPHVKTLIFSMHDNQEYIVQSVENGASGYLLKDTNKSEIMKAIKTVASGNKYFPPHISAQIITVLLEKTRANESNIKQNINIKELSKKENQILPLLAEGLSSQEIATKLFLSIRTVSNHRANIIKKTKVKNTAELIKLAYIG